MDASQNSTPEPVRGPTEISSHRVDMTRVGPHHYRARNAAGAELDFGRGEGLLTPVELLLAAIAGCSSVDVDTVVSRRSEFTGYDVSAEGTKVQEDGASRLTGIRLHFDLSFPDDESGRRAAGMVDRVVQLSHDKNCTVSRTVELGEPVAFTTDVTLDTADDTTDDGTDD